MSSDVDFQFIEQEAAPGFTLHYVEPDDPSCWWTSRRLALVPDGYVTAEDSTVAAILVGNIDPLDSGTNEVQWRPLNAARVDRRRALCTIPVSAVSEPVQDRGYKRLCRERDQHRIAHGLPRVVVRSGGYVLRHPWPAGTFLQAGSTYARVPATAAHKADPDVYVHEGHALVESGRFMEAFPETPSTFLRGEGATFIAAEDALWARWTRITGCGSPSGSHEYETRGYRNGAGICVHCGLFSSGVFDLKEIGSVCAVCGVGTYWDIVGELLYCQEHAPPR